MFEVLGLIFGVLVFCPFWDRVCDTIFDTDYGDF
jgi:hypothetical protein